MAITFVSSASAASNTVTMPSHQAGDMIVIQTFNKSSVTIPTAVSGYKSYTSTGTASAVRYSYKIAASGSETVGTWTDATAITVSVYRILSSESWLAPVVYTDSGTGTSMTYAEGSFYGTYFFPRERNTEAWMLRFACHATATNVGSTTPTGWMSRGSAGGAFAMDSGRGVPEDTALDIGGDSIAVDTSGEWNLATIQLRAWNGLGVACVYAKTGGAASSFTGIDLASGDIIVCFAARSDSNTPPTLPAGYTSFDSGGANTLSALLCYRVAAASDGVPTFTNATSWTFMAYRAAKGSFTTIMQFPKSGISTTMDWAGSGLTPLGYADSKYIRFGTFRGTGWPSFASGWPIKAVRVAATPANFASDTEPVVNADSIGVNTITLGASMAWRTYTVQVISEKFTAKVENTNVTNAAVPAGIGGCYVTLIGGGGGGGGTNKPSSGGYGGGGGGGGAAIKRAFIPANALGSTYSLSWGLGGSGGTTSPTAGTNGGASVFSSGSITFTAGGGTGGAAGGSGTSAGGAAGTFNAVGWGGWAFDAAENGGLGGNGSRSGSSGNGSVGANAAYAGPGGGGGGGNVSSAGTGYAGGSSLNVTGGAGGSASGGAGGSPANATLGLSGAGGGGGGGNAGFGASGGAGGKGSVAGAGGGGAGGKEGFAGNGNSGGAGGNGYALIEWVAPLDSGQFFRAYDGF